jgi:hypothetical protein
VTDLAAGAAEFENLRAIPMAEKEDSFVSINPHASRYLDSPALP